MQKPSCLLVAVLFALAVACGGKEHSPATATQSPPTQAPAATATATPPPTPTPRPRPEANAFPPDLQQEAEGLLQQIVELRGTPLKQPVDMFLLTRDQARRFYANESQAAAPTPPALDSSTPVPGTPTPAPIDPKQEVYELLGMAPKPEPVEGGQGSIEQEQLDNLVSILTGFYDPGFNAFYMIDTINGGIHGALAKSTIVHEFTHALQYQETDLQALADERAANADAMTALLSVMEGDAVNTEIEVLGYSTRSTYRQPQCFKIPAPMRPGTPYVVERELDVWYEDGLCFVQAIAARDPGGIGRIFANPPTTMEQILHPEKYLAGEAARPVENRDLSEALGAGWSQGGEGVFGEFGLQNVLLPGMVDERPAVQEAAAGWGGDGWQLYLNGDGRLLQLQTVWDSEDDAQQFVQALHRSLANRSASLSDLASGLQSAQLGEHDWRFWQQGDAVTVLASTDAAALDAATGALRPPAP